MRESKIFSLAAATSFSVSKTKPKGGLPLDFRMLRTSCCRFVGLMGSLVWFFCFYLRLLPVLSCILAHLPAVDAKKEAWQGPVPWLSIKP